MDQPALKKQRTTTELFFNSRTAIEPTDPSLMGYPSAARHLSTMQLLSHPLILDDLEGLEFYTTEAAFVAKKLLFSGADISVIQRLSKGGDLYLNPYAAKLLGAKKHNPMSDEQLMKWNNESESIMLDLLQQRFRTDEVFRLILEDAKKKGITLRHLQKGSEKNQPLWGCCRLKKTGQIVGKDRYGKLLMSILELKPN